MNREKSVDESWKESAARHSSLDTFGDHQYLDVKGRLSVDAECV